MRHTWFFFVHAVRTILFFSFFKKIRPLPYVAINRICMQCVCSMSAHPYTSDRYVFESRIICTLRGRGRRRVLGRETTDNRHDYIMSKCKWKSTQMRHRRVFCRRQVNERRAKQIFLVDYRGLMGLLTATHCAYVLLLILYIVFMLFLCRDVRACKFNKGRLTTLVYSCISCFLLTLTATRSIIGIVIDERLMFERSQHRPLEHAWMHICVIESFGLNPRNSGNVAMDDIPLTNMYL